MSNPHSDSAADNPVSEYKSILDQLPPDEILRMAARHAHPDGEEHLVQWLDGKLELSNAEVEEVVKQISRITYEQNREKISEKWGVRVSALDAIRQRSNDGGESKGQGAALFFKEPQPWPEPVDGAVLLDDLAELFLNYIVLPEGAAEALALWIAFAWFHDSFQISPLLAITSPQKRCGKTSLLMILGQFVPRPLPTANLTPAALYRAVQSFSPTLLADEADTFFRDNHDLRGVLNSGHLRNQAWILRCVEPDFEPRNFKVWGPKAIALIGRLDGPWSSLADQAITIQLQRKRPDETAERLRMDRLPKETEELRQKLARWAADLGAEVATLEPEELPFLNDRQADNWRPLLAIAKLASDSFASDPAATWEARARKAARLLSGGEKDDDIQILLLKDLRALFAEREAAWLGSTETIYALNNMEGQPWADFAGGKGLSTAKLAELLRPFGAESREKKLPEGKVLRGYFFSDLEPVFSRYLTTNAVNSLPHKDSTGSTLVAGSTSEVLPEKLEVDPVAPQNATRYQGATEEGDTDSLQNKEIGISGDEGSAVAAPAEDSEGQLDLFSDEETPQDGNDTNICPGKAVQSQEDTNTKTARQLQRVKQGVDGQVVEESSSEIGRACVADLEDCIEKDCRYWAGDQGDCTYSPPEGETRQEQKRRAIHLGREGGKR